MKKFLIVLLCIISAIALLLIGLTVANKINEHFMLEYIDTFSKVEFENQLTPEYDSEGNAYFTTDGDFKVMHLTDIHLTGGVFNIENDKKVINAVAAMVTEEKPDLVVVTGDISFAVPWHGSINNIYAHNFFTSLMETLGVYYTATLGNHDSEGYNFYNRQSVATMYENDDLKYCLFDKGPTDVFGYGNHVINVKNSKGLVTKSLIMLDSNSYTEDDPWGIKWIYDNIHEDQINWYKETVEYYSAQNKSVLASLPDAEKPADISKFETVQSLLFCHIPIMEFRTAYTEYVNNGRQNSEDITYIDGNIGEVAPYIYASEIEENLFETILELGSTKALFFGHDHYNNLVMEYKGITFSYGYSLDYSAYSGISGEGYQRGCAVINCTPDTSFTITHENYYQDKYVPLYPKEDVDMTKQ